MGDTFVICESIGPLQIGNILKGAVYHSLKDTDLINVAS